MATLSQAKTLGGVGSILIFIPFVSLVGYILMIIAVKEISDDLQDKTIFNNILVAAVTGIIGAFAGAIIILVSIGDLAKVSVSAGLAADRGAFLGVLGGLLVVWIFLVISAVFLRRAYDTMSEKLGVGMFNTAATFYLIGAALTIVFVGFILLIIAEIMQAVAYFSIPDRPPGQGMGGSTGPVGSMGAPAAPMAQAPPPGAATKFCTSCGTRISPSATFCYSCGAKQA
jgi:uncharacterized membrane protein